MTITIPAIKLPANWKTSLAGVASLAFATYQSYAVGFNVSATIHNPAFQSALITGVIGLLAKDFNVTGGSVGQASTPQALADANQHPSVINAPVGPQPKLEPK